jgi:hypothetical protein|tara:strand:- start:285 stop:851 length:567 start_codon:yes stop_codon:yes gene_type:complete
MMLHRNPTPKILAAIQEKYELLDIINVIDIDHNFSMLEERLLNIKKESFAPNERILINHTDTDYYDKKILKYGLILYNILYTIMKIDIPCFTILFYTNNIGVSKEVMSILDDFNYPTVGRPTIIESFLTNLHYNPKACNDLPIRAQEIKFSALSMMGASRSHRYSLYNYLNKNNLLDSVKVSIRGYKE